MRMSVSAQVLAMKSGPLVFRGRPRKPRRKILERSLPLWRDQVAEHVFFEQALRELSTGAKIRKQCFAERLLSCQLNMGSHNPLSIPSLVGIPRAFSRLPNVGEFDTIVAGVGGENLFFGNDQRTLGTCGCGQIHVLCGECGS